MAHSGSKTSVGLLSLKWNNYKSIFFETIKTLREKSKYTDATLAVDGHFYHVHKLVMSTCSDYFSDIFENTPCKAPIIVLKDVSKDEIEGLLSYMYLGEVNVHHNKLASFLKTAESLKIKGLAVSDDEPTNLSKSQHSNEDSSSLKKRRLDNNESSPAVPPVKSLKKSDTPLMMKVEMSSPDVSTAKQNKPPMDNIGSSEGDERERRIRTKISYEEDPVSDQDSGDVYEPHSPVTEQEDLEHDMPDHEAPDNVEENNASTSFFGTALQQSEDDQWRDMALANVTTSLHKQGHLLCLVLLLCALYLNVAAISYLCEGTHLHRRFVVINVNKFTPWLADFFYLFTFSNILFCLLIFEIQFIYLYNRRYYIVYMGHHL